MRDFRLKALKRFFAKPMAPWFAVNMPDLDFDDIYYYVKPTEGQVKDWDELPDVDQDHLREARHPRGRAQVPGRRHGPVRVPPGVDAGVDHVGACGRSRSWRRATRCSRSTRPRSSCRRGRVVAARCSGTRRVFEITARGRTIGASANHPFLVLRDERAAGRKNARYRAAWVPVEDLAVGDLVAIATDVPEFGTSASLLVPDRPEARRFPTATTDDLCWWAGRLPGRRLPQAGSTYPVGRDRRRQDRRRSSSRRSAG